MTWSARRTPRSPATRAGGHGAGSRSPGRNGRALRTVARRPGVLNISDYRNRRSLSGGHEQGNEDEEGGRGTVLAIAYAWGFVIWVDALALWARMFGLVGVIVGLLTVSDQALPFV